jgi:hypothetical protein
MAETKASRPHAECDQIASQETWYTGFLEPERTRFRHDDRDFCGKSVSHQFPPSYIADVLSAWELGDAEQALVISYGHLRPRAAQGSSRSKELRYA